MNQKINPSLSILFENDFFIVIDKPAGLTSHNETKTESSVVSLMPKNYQLAHRLDKETSGILLIAKSNDLVAELMEALQDQSSEKKYIAILRGGWKHPKNNMDWSWPITDKGEGRRDPQGLSKDRKSSLTKIKMMQANAYFTQIEASLETGRQHQIRKHAALAKQAIVGDPRYNDPKYNEKIFSLYQFDRMLLHAFSLKFVFRGHEYSIQAPVPDLFLRFWS